jgi:HPt (histidine-containing phosphotransfer) domain-containing protein
MPNITSLHEIEKLAQGDKKILQEFLEIFVKEGSLQVQKLQKYLDTRDHIDLRNTTHKLKSSLMIIGLDFYRPLAEDIELNGEKDPTKTKQQVLELMIVYKRALSELKMKLEELYHDQNL